MPLRAYGLTDQGRVRPTNEDCFAIHEELGLCVVADGMGGHNAGEVAARLAVDAVVHLIRDTLGDAQDWPFGFDGSLSADGNLLRTAIHLANVQIREAAIASHDYAGMGTTIVATRFSPRSRGRSPSLERPSSPSAWVLDSMASAKRRDGDGSWWPWTAARSRRKL